MDSLFKDIKKVTDEAVDRGYKNANEEWKDYAIECLRQVCLSKEIFTVADVRNLIDMSPIKTHDKRAIGGVFRTGKSMGMIARTGIVHPNIVGHGVGMQVWKSLLFKK